MLVCMGTDVTRECLPPSRIAWVEHVDSILDVVEFFPIEMSPFCFLTSSVWENVIHKFSIHTNIQHYTLKATRGMRRFFVRSCASEDVKHPRGPPTNCWEPPSRCDNPRLQHTFPKCPGEKLAPDYSKKLPFGLRQVSRELCTWTTCVVCFY